MAQTNKVQGEGVLQGIVMIPLTDIIADEKFNARKDYNGETQGSKRDNRQSIEDLARSIKSDGQLQPVLVTKTEKGKYFLRFGFRRFKALQHLGEEFIKVQVWDGNEADAMMINLAENCARNELHAWEIAQRCVEIAREHKLSGNEIAVRIGKSKGHVNNLMRIVEKLDKKIFEAWTKGDGRATFDNLIKLAKMDDKAEQQAQWAEWGGEGADDEEDEEGEGGEPKTGPKRPTKRHLEAALEAVKKMETGDLKTGCRNALMFALGKAKTIPGVYNPAKPPKDDEE